MTKLATAADSLRGQAEAPAPVKPKKPQVSGLHEVSLSADGDAAVGELSLTNIEQRSYSFVYPISPVACARPIDGGSPRLVGRAPNTFPAKSAWSRPDRALGWRSSHGRLQACEGEPVPVGPLYSQSHG